MLLGLESGTLNLWIAAPSATEHPTIWNLVYQAPDYFMHTLTVKRIKFNQRYVKTGEDKEEYTVATCGSDHTVRIFKIKL